MSKRPVTPEEMLEIAGALDGEAAYDESYGHPKEAWQHRIAADALRKHAGAETTLWTCSLACQVFLDCEKEALPEDMKCRIHLKKLEAGELVDAEVCGRELVEMIARPVVEVDCD